MLVSHQNRVLTTVGFEIGILEDFRCFYCTVIKLHGCNEWAAARSDQTLYDALYLTSQRYLSIYRENTSCTVDLHILLSSFQMNQFSFMRLDSAYSKVKPLSLHLKKKFSALAFFGGSVLESWSPASPDTRLINISLSMAIFSCACGNERDDAWDVAAKERRNAKD